jgi:hypothetical protein
VAFGGDSLCCFADQFDGEFFFGYEHLDVSTSS